MTSPRDSSSPSPNLGSPAQSASTPTSTFHRFSLLPTELRLQIWKQTIQKRIIRTPNRQGGILTEHLVDLPCPRAEFLATKYPLIPPILHTCREAREVGLKYYQWVAWIDRGERDEKGRVIGGERKVAYYIYPGFDIQPLGIARVVCGGRVQRSTPREQMVSE